MATTLNQSLLHGEVISGNADGKTVHDPGTHDLKDVDWVHHDQTAYLFPEPAEVQLENGQRSGFWHEINDQSWARRLGEVHKDVFTLWLGHGVRPGQDGYEYIVVPGIEASEVEEYSRRSSIEILSNTPKVQAVRHTGLNISQIIFYEQGKVKLSGDLTLATDKPAMVMVEAFDSEVVKITVSDPNRNQETIFLTLSHSMSGEDSNRRSEWDVEKDSTTFQFDLPQEEYAGQSVIVEP